VVVRVRRRPNQISLSVAFAVADSEPPTEASKLFVGRATAVTPLRHLWRERLEDSERWLVQRQENWPCSPLTTQQIGLAYQRPNDDEVVASQTAEAVALRARTTPKASSRWLKPTAERCQC
jgi:hypothetical protein